MSLRSRFFLFATILVLATVAPVGIYSYLLLDESMELWHNDSVKQALQESLFTLKEGETRQQINEALISYNQLGALREPLERKAIMAGSAFILTMVLLAGFVSWLLAYQITRPIRDLASASGRIAEGDLSREVPPTRIGEMRPLVESFNDMIHGLKEYRTALAKAERRAAWQDIARAIAHEIKNPLTPMRLTTERLRQRFFDNRKRFDDTFMRSTEMILTEIQRLERLANSFSGFAKMPAAELHPLDLRDVVNITADLYATDIETGRLVVSIPEHPVWALADNEQLQQALVNLVKNAFEAVDEMRENADDSGSLCATLSLTADPRNAVLRVTDTGPGIPADAMEKLFRPYVSTKPDGSGIGLPVVERVVTDHKGRVVVRNVQPHGAEFEIRIPIAEEGVHEGSDY